MTPERAKVLALAECLMDYPDQATVDTMVRSILAACDEERREAMEAAARVCEEQGRFAGDGTTFYTATGQCAAAIRAAARPTGK